MSNNCTNCSRRCTPATDCDTCPACRLLLARAQAANREALRMRACAAVCAGLAFAACAVIILLVI